VLLWLLAFIKALKYCLIKLNYTAKSFNYSLMFLGKWNSLPSFNYVWEGFLTIQPSLNLCFNYSLLLLSIVYNIILNGFPFPRGVEYNKFLFIYLSSSINKPSSNWHISYRICYLKNSLSRFSRFTCMSQHWFLFIWLVKVEGSLSAVVNDVLWSIYS